MDIQILSRGSGPDDDFFRLVPLTVLFDLGRKFPKVPPKGVNITFSYCRYMPADRVIVRTSRGVKEPPCPGQSDTVLSIYKSIRGLGRVCLNRQMIKV